MKLLIVLLLTITMGYTKELNEVNNYNEAVIKAKKEKKKVLMFIYSDFCPWCEKMKKTTLKDDEAIEFINSRYIFVKVNKESSHYPQKLKPDIIPTTYLLDPNTQENLYTLHGYKPTEHLINELWDE